MLNRRNLLILTGILVVLIVISVAQRRTPTERNSEVLVAGEYARSDLGRLTIGYGQDAEAVVLENGPEGWFLPTAWNARASDQRLDALLQSLSELRGEFRSDSPEVVPDYGFSDSTTVTLRGYDPGGGELFALEVGGKPEGGRGNFVKRPGSDEVFLTGANLLSNLGLWSGPDRPTSRHFLELQAFRGEREAVDRLVLGGAEELTLIKEFETIVPDSAVADSTGAEPTVDRSQWEWRLEGPDGEKLGMAVKTRADGVLGAAVNVRAQDVVDPHHSLEGYGLGDGARTVTIVLADGSERRLAFGDQREAEGDQPGGYYMVDLDAPDTVWVVGEYAANNIFKSREDLLPAPE
jgi:hypothetical protein